MLIVCLVLSAATPRDFVSSSTNNEKYYFFLLANLGSFWNIFVTGIALFFELIYFVSRFLNIRCYNNYYKVYGILVRANIPYSQIMLAIAI